MSLYMQNNGELQVVASASTGGGGNDGSKTIHIWRDVNNVAYIKGIARLRVIDKLVVIDDVRMSTILFNADGSPSSWASGSGNYFLLSLDEIPPISSPVKASAIYRSVNGTTTGEVVFYDSPNAMNSRAYIVQSNRGGVDYLNFFFDYKDSNDNLPLCEQMVIMYSTV